MRVTASANSTGWTRLRQFSTAHLPAFVALLLALAFAFILPAYSGPDEEGHVAYVAAFAQGHVPIIPDGQIADIETGTSWQGQHPPRFDNFFLIGPSASTIWNG